MRKPWNYIIGFVIITVILVAPTVFVAAINGIVDFSLWLLFLDSVSFDLPLWAEIIGKVLTLPIALAIVGFTFKLFGFFNSKAMKFAYAIVSIIVAYLLNLFLYFFINNWVWVLICLCIAFIISVVCSIIWYLKDR